MPAELKSLTPIKRTTLTDEIVNRLTGYIIEAELKPGDRLPPERELMESLGVGRSSLREAIKTLSAVGALVVMGKKGTFVGQGGAASLTKPLFWTILLGERSMREVIESRRIVEVGLAGLAAQRATTEDIATISAHVELMRGSFTDLDMYTQHDLDFHIAVAKAAQNRVMSQVLETLRYVIRAWIGKNIHAVADGRPISFSEHVHILDAIRNRDPEAASKCMAMHLDRAAALVVNDLASNLGTEDWASITA